MFRPDLNEDIENFAFSVHGPPEIDHAARDPHIHLIQMPNRKRLRARLAQVRRDLRSEAVHPAAHGLVGDNDSTLPAGKSSTSRKLRVKRRYSQIACRMISGGKRQPS